MKTGERFASKGLEIGLVFHLSSPESLFPGTAVSVLQRWDVDNVLMLSNMGKGDRDS